MFYLKQRLATLLRGWRLMRATQAAQADGPGYRSLAALLQAERCWDGKLCLVDIGARGDLPPEWQASRAFLQCVGFEPEAEECARLNREAATRQVPWVYIPCAIGARAETVPFYLTRFPFSSGLLKTNEAFLRRLYPSARENLAVHRELPMPVLPLAQALRESGRNFAPDFIKIDVEGAEADVLDGAAPLFDEGTVLGVYTEVWLGPLKDRLELVRIEQFMQRHGFYLFKFEAARTPRASFPHGDIQWNRFGLPVRLRQHAMGQIIAGDMLYLRDPIWEDTEGNSRFPWRDDTVLKMLLIYEAYGYPDCAVELLDYYASKHQTTLPIARMRDALTPAPPSGPPVGYRRHVELSERLDDHEEAFFVKHRYH